MSEIDEKQIRDDRLKKLQSIRMDMVENISKCDNYARDPELATTVLQALKDVERQDLYFDKKEMDKEEGDKNRATALEATQIATAIRNQRRQEYQQDTSQVPDIAIPEFDSKKISATPDAQVLANRNFQELDWSSFRAQMQAEGIDPTAEEKEQA